MEEYRNEKSEVNITRVVIDTRNGARAMGKPMGTYITLEAPGLNEPDEDYHREVSEGAGKADPHPASGRKGGKIRPGGRPWES